MFILDKMFQQNRPEYSLEVNTVARSGKRIKTFCVYVFDILQLRKIL